MLNECQAEILIGHLCNLIQSWSNFLVAIIENCTENGQWPAAILSPVHMTVFTGRVISGTVDSGSTSQLFSHHMKKLGSRAWERGYFYSTIRIYAGTSGLIKNRVRIYKLFGFFLLLKLATLLSPGWY